MCYGKLRKLLIDKKMKQTDLVKQAKISSNVLQKWVEKSLSQWKVLLILSLLECIVGDILEFIDTDDIIKAGVIYL